MQSCLRYQRLVFIRGYVAIVRRHVGRYGASGMHLLGGSDTLGRPVHLGIAAELRLLEKEEEEEEQEV